MNSLLSNSCAPPERNPRVLPPGLAGAVVGLFKPKVIIADEPQDLSRLQIAVIRQWAQRGAGHLFFAADHDQCIVRHTGASPEALFANAGAKYFREVRSPQSYRVLRQVHALADAWIHQTPPGVSRA
jgi:superfamily I DNA/RNA helicase